jgi:hypothetical protein
MRAAHMFITTFISAHALALPSLQAQGERVAVATLTYCERRAANDTIVVVAPTATISASHVQWQPGGSTIAVDPVKLILRGASFAVRSKPGRCLRTDFVRRHEGGMRWVHAWGPGFTWVLGNRGEARVAADSIVMGWAR